MMREREFLRMNKELVQLNRVAGEVLLNTVYESKEHRSISGVCEQLLLALMLLRVFYFILQPIIKKAKPKIKRKAKRNKHF